MIISYVHNTNGNASLFTADRHFQMRTGKNIHILAYTHTKKKGVFFPSFGCPVKDRAFPHRTAAKGRPWVLTKEHYRCVDCAALLFDDFGHYVQSQQIPLVVRLP